MPKLPKPVDAGGRLWPESASRVVSGRAASGARSGFLADSPDNRAPGLARAIAAAAPSTPLQEVREAALILLYRLLFILYAEDRDLLPVRDSRYDDYGLRERVRGDVGQRKDRNDTFANRAGRSFAGEEGPAPDLRAALRARLVYMRAELVEMLGP